MSPLSRFNDALKGCASGARGRRAREERMAGRYSDFAYGACSGWSGLPRLWPSSHESGTGGARRARGVAREVWTDALPQRNCGRVSRPSLEAAG